MRNLLQGKFLGPVMPMTTKHTQIMGVECYKTIDTLPLTPDLAIICPEADSVYEHVEELGRRGTLAIAIVGQETRRSPPLEYAAILEIARNYGIRILGPHSLGFIAPTVGVHASLATYEALPGKIAFVTQSDTLFMAILDWATSKGIGFSQCISLGDRLDVHFEDVLDFLHDDPNTRAVLLYVETIAHARHFMSAARALARNKPVLVLKSGKSPAGALAASLHSGMFTGADDVYDAAIRRAGMLRVEDIDSLFDTAETLALAKPLRGNALAIVSNGGSPAFLATDTLLSRNGTLATFSTQTQEQLAPLLHNKIRNPLILRNDTARKTFPAVLESMLQDKNISGILLIHAPQPAVDSAEIAHLVAAACKRTKKVILTCWMGSNNVENARQILRNAKVPSFSTPEKAVHAFLNIAEYHANQNMLRETPPSLPDSFIPTMLPARRIVAAALEEGRQSLTAQEVEEILCAYQIPTAQLRLVNSTEQAIKAAQQIGFPVAVKIASPDIYRKSLAGGIALDIANEKEVSEAIKSITTRIRSAYPKAAITGFTVQKMSRYAHARELAIETATDPVFGPIIRFGQGGAFAAANNLRQTALPPLNIHLAQELLRRSQTYPPLEGNNHFPAVNIEALGLTLVKISQLLIDIPEIFEMEMDPVYADEHGVVVLDGTIRVAWSGKSGTEQLSICPYPKELEEQTTLPNGIQINIRPIRPEDEPDHWNFLEHMSLQDKRFRFFGNVSSLPRNEMVKLTQIDYDREMAFLAKGESPDGTYATLGVARAIISPDNSIAEFAVAIRSDCKRIGLGRVLMQTIIRYLASRGTRQITGEALGDNKNMVELANALGFTVTKDYDENIYSFTLSLAESPAAPPLL